MAHNVRQGSARGNGGDGENTLPRLSRHRTPEPQTAARKSRGRARGPAVSQARRQPGARPPDRPPPSASGAWKHSGGGEHVSMIPLVELAAEAAVGNIWLREQQHRPQGDISLIDRPLSTPPSSPATPAGPGGSPDYNLLPRSRHCASTSCAGGLFRGPAATAAARSGPATASEVCWSVAGQPTQIRFKLLCSWLARPGPHLEARLTLALPIRTSRGHPIHAPGPPLHELSPSRMLL